MSKRKTVSMEFGPTYYFRHLLAAWNIFPTDDKWALYIWIYISPIHLFIYLLSFFIFVQQICIILYVNKILDKKNGSEQKKKLFIAKRFGSKVIHTKNHDPRPSFPVSNKFSF